MAKRSTRRRSSPAPRQQRGQGWVKRTILAVGVAGMIALIGVFMFTRGGGADTPAASAPASDPTVELARRLAGTEIEIHKGSLHTVYHSLGALPSSASPRADGRPTLVWFSAPT